MVAIDLACQEKLKAAEEEIERLKAEVARLQSMVAYLKYPHAGDIPSDAPGKGAPFYQPPSFH